MASIQFPKASHDERRGVNKVSGDSLLIFIKSKTYPHFCHSLFLYSLVLSLLQYFYLLCFVTPPLLHSQRTNNNKKREIPKRCISKPAHKAHAGNQNKRSPKTNISKWGNKRQKNCSRITHPFPVGCDGLRDHIRARIEQCSLERRFDDRWYLRRC
jgi:hypothetical protein